MFLLSIACALTGEETERERRGGHDGFVGGWGFFGGGNILLIESFPTPLHDVNTTILFSLLLLYYSVYCPSIAFLASFFL